MEITQSASMTLNNFSHCPERDSGFGIRISGPRELFLRRIAKPDPRKSGFTLIELLLVMVIIAILAAVVVPKFTGRTEQARITAAKADIASMKVALGAFETDTGRFPTTEEGLQALVTAPAGIQGWTHAYIEKVPTDPWGHPYVYRCPGSNGKDFDLFSTGPSGREGAPDNVEP